MIAPPLADLIKQLARLPGLGPRSAQRVALHLLTNKESLSKLQDQLTYVADTLTLCDQCYSITLSNPCDICQSPKRTPNQICVVKDIADIWAIERSGAFAGHYHVLGNLLSAMDGVGPEDIRIPQLIKKVEALDGEVEVILALSASVDGQTSSHYIAQRLKASGAKVSTLAKGLPVGADVDYMDDGTLSIALSGRQELV